MQQPGLDLASAVAALRMELLEAMASSDPEIGVHFPVGEIVLTFQVVAGRQGDARAGVKFWVVEASTGGTLSKQETHTVTVTLKPPVDDDGQPIKINRKHAQLPG